MGFSGYGCCLHRRADGVSEQSFRCFQHGHRHTGILRHVHDHGFGCFCNSLQRVGKPVPEGKFRGSAEVHHKYNPKLFPHTQSLQN